MASRAQKIKGIYLRGNVFWFTHGTGKGRIQLSLETSDEAEAIEKARSILENPALNPSNGFLKELNRYVDENVADGTWTANSRVSKLAVLKMFGEDVGFKDLPDISEGEIQDWHGRQRKRIPKTAHSYMLIIRAFFNWAVEQKLIRKSPAAEIELGKVNRTARVKFCTFQQRDDLVKAAEGNDDLLFILFCGFYAGMRKEEIIEARPDWFDLDQNIVHVEKTATFNVKNKKYLAVPLHPDFKKFLERYGKREPFMLKPEVEKGKARYRYDFRKPFANFMKGIKLPWVTPHVMRHSFASLLAIQGVSLFKVARWLGDTLATTERHYAHLEPQDDAIGLLSAPNPHAGPQWTPKEIAALQQKVEDYEVALKTLVRADKLAEYWDSLKAKGAGTG